MSTLTTSIQHCRTGSVGQNSKAKKKRKTIQTERKDVNTLFIEDTIICRKSNEFYKIMKLVSECSKY